MKIWLLNNTKIDKYKEWEIYFNNIFIPLLEKHSKHGDIIIHLGHIFNNSELVQTKLINKSMLMFQKIAEITPIYFLDGYDTELLKLFKSIKNTTIIDSPISLYGVKLIPKKYNIIEYIDNEDKLVFINSQIDQSLLENYNNHFYCGLYNMKNEHKNIINVGTPYQFDNKSSSGIYVVDSITSKKKYIRNKISNEYNIIKITDINQINDLDSEYINNNNISIEIDKALIDEKKIKIDVLLNEFDFKSISYINDNVDDIELVDSYSLKMEELLTEKIKNSDNKNLLSDDINLGQYTLLFFPT